MHVSRAQTKYCCLYLLLFTKCCCVQSDETMSGESREDVSLILGTTHTTNFIMNDLLTIIKLRDGTVTSGTYFMA